MKQNRNPRGKTKHLWTPLIKEAKIYNGEKTISLTNGAGKTGQPFVKEQQGLADGHIAIIGHHCQYIALCIDKEAVEKQLSHASCIGDGVPL